MKVGMIFTGGTIGTVEDHEHVRVLDDSNDGLLMSCFDKDDEIIRTSPFLVMSENIKAADLNVLERTVRDMIGEVDGIVITYGMDTLQYAAAFLGYSFADADIPIMMLTSFKPLDQEGSNGMTNLRCALDFIRNRRGTGVFVPYSDDNVTTYIHMGTRLLQNYDYQLKVRSISGMYVGYYDCDGYHSNELCCGCDRSGRIDCTGLKERSGIMVVRPYVGMPGTYVPEDVTDVILVPYRSGTMDLTDEILTDMLDGCRKKNISMWMVGKIPGVDYSSMSGLDDVKILPKMTVVSTYVKLWMIRSSGLDAKRMSEPVAGDIII